MENITTSGLAEITGGKLTGLPELIVKDILTDSRSFGYSEGAAFFAVRGRNHDGHKFIRQLYERGIRIFVVMDIPEDPDEYSMCSFILVADTITALHALAAYRRSCFPGTVIAVTGSSGKTIVKEWLADIMGISGSVVRSPRSYNSQIGVPLSVWKLSDKYTTGIFEAGISQTGEMEKLERIIRPDIGIITNIGDAHGENFIDNREKAAEKLKLLKNCRAIVYCRDYEVIHEMITKEKDLEEREIAGWSFSDKKSRFRITTKIIVHGNTEITISHDGIKSEFRIPFSDRASIENSVTVAVTCIILGVKTGDIEEGMKRLVAVAMRMELKTGINGCMLIEDYYNSDPGSLGMALDYMQSQGNRNSVLILSDFLQSGRNEEELYTGVSELVRRSGIKRFIGIGEALSAHRKSFREDSRFYHSTEEFLQKITLSEFSDEIILLKGARVFEFERISHLLEQQVHQTVLEINLDAISNNLNEFRKHLNPGTRIMAMVKAFAYGAGASEIASFLEFHRVDYLAVAYADEGVDLRKAGVTAPIVVMNPEVSAYGIMITHNLEPEIYSFTLLAEFSAAAARHGLVDYPVHIKIDTGMHRLGFLPSETEALAGELSSSGSLKVISAFSHLSASEDPKLDDFSRKQAEIFLWVTAKLREALGYGFLRHLLNSAGICRFPEYQFEMVRPGIGLYGIGSCNELKLKHSGRYRTRISQVKTVPAGEPVGYGCSDISERNRQIAIVPVGYADGFDRKLGNRTGRLFVKNHFVPVVGNVCMDMCMADVTGADAMEGDEVEIFGDNIPVEEIAEKCGTIPYEILTSIPVRVKRVFYRE